MRFMCLVVFSLFLAASSFAPIHVSAAVCQNKTKVVFGNGVFNTRDDAGKSRDYLEDSLGRRAKFSPFVDLAYANDGGAALTFPLAVGALPAMGQLLELFLQSGVVDTTNYWKWVSDASAAPQWFRDGMKQIAAGVNGANYVLDGDVQRHVTIYEASLKAGNKVVIVSHSQGNFYSNAAYRVLTQRGYGNNVGIVAVATPSRIVEGGGTYITAPEDKIIKAVRILSFGFVLPANFGNLIRPRNADWFNHNFINFYMRGVETKAFIIDDIVKAENRLQYPSRPSSVLLDGVLPNATAKAALQGMVAAGASTYAGWGGYKSLTVTTNAQCGSSFTIDNSSGLTPELKRFLIALGYGDAWRFLSVGPSGIDPSLIFSSLGALRAYADPRLLGTNFFYCSPDLTLVESTRPSNGITVNVYELYSPNGTKRCDWFAIYEAYPYFDGFNLLFKDSSAAVDKQVWADGLLQKVKAYYGAL